MTDGSNKRLAFWIAFVLAMSLVFPAGTALASHETSDTQTLDVEPETAQRSTGTTHTMTATVSNPVDHSTQVDAELQAGSPNDQDGTTYGTPDLTCTIPTGGTSCVLSYTGRNTGTDTIRAWIDYDNSNATVEADQNEQRDETATPPPVGETNADGTGCPADPPPPSQPPPTNLPGDPTEEPQEPDCTDVVSVTWSGEDERPATLDCDDSRGPDTERETNQSTSSPSATSDEVYHCTVRSQFGDQMAGVEVKGEVENGINDPDEPDGDSKDRPDYQCVTEDAPFDEAPFGGVAYCEITVRQWEGEQGKADICFWVGDAATGNILCANEDVGEDQNQQPPHQGDGTGNDLADRVWKAWHEHELNCEPETDTNPTNTQHEITCTVQSVSRDPNTGQPTQRGAGIHIDVEASGANDPQNDGDTATSRQTPDFTCTTRSNDPTTPANEGGTCVIRHGPGGTGSTANTGITLYRAWIDIDNNDNTDEADPAEGRDENTQPGSELEPDDTDVVEKRWGGEPTRLTITPDSDSAPVGSCNAYTINTTGGSNNTTPTQGATIDVEQRHERAQNGTANDEPRVSFCMPNEGPNPSMVDESRGDLRPPQEEPDNPGTAGGETTESTDAQGNITIGIMVTPANGSNGSGRVDIIAFWERTDNDDPDSGEPQDTATKNWVASQARSIDCEPETATNAVGTQHVVTCTVRNAAGQPVQSEGVTFTETGPGTITPTQANTDQNGQARTTSTSNETGTQTITGTITSDTQGAEPGDVDECDRAANDPQGSPAGQCSDSVEKTWVESRARSIDCDPEAATNATGTQHVVTCIVRDPSGQPVSGEGVTFTEQGPGSVSPAQATTDQNGAARTTATSSQAGTQTITGTITEDTQGAEPGEVDECDRAANDPQGAAAGACADSVTKTWEEGPDGGPTRGPCRGFGFGTRTPKEDGSGGMVIVGTPDDDILIGTDEDDTICALGGDDQVDALGGTDQVVGNKGGDEIDGGTGKDQLNGNRGHDQVSGRGGNDVIIGARGSDTLKGNRGIDSLRGEDDDDILQGGKHEDTVIGGTGADTLRGWTGADVLKAGRGHDIINGHAGFDICRGGRGNDAIRNCERSRR